MSLRPNLAIVGSPASTVRYVADLKGRRVSVSAFGSPTQLALNYLLVSHGLKPDDITTIAIGTGATSVAALEHTPRTWRRCSDCCTA